MAIRSNPAVKTVGVDPKVGYPALALGALGVVLCVLDKVGVIEIPDEIWITLIGAAVGGGGIGAASPPALQEPKLPVSASASTTLPDPPR